MASNGMSHTSAEPRDLVFTRTFNAPVERLWKAWTEPEYVKQWWGPTHFTCPSAEMNVSEGATSLLCMRAPKKFGGQDFYSTWDYERIVPMERIVYIHNLADSAGVRIDPASVGMPPEFPVDQRHVITFKPLEGDRTELTVTEEGWTPGQMMEMSRMGMEQCLDKMAAAVEG